MDNRKKIIIITLIVATIALLAFIIWLLLGPKNINNVKIPFINNNPKTVATGKATAVLPVSSPGRVAEEKKYPLGLKQLALSFAERYGSYSTDQKYKNLDDLKIFMSDKMQKNIDDLIQSDKLATGTPASFQGFTTRGLSANLLSSNADTAVVMVQTQRTISTDSGLDPVISYKNLKLSFVKLNNEWKVDEAIWQ